MSFEVTFIRFFFAVVLCIGSVVSFAWTDGQCPCANQSLCQPIQVGPRREKFTFIVNVDNWRSYDYSQLTTIALFVDHLVPEFYCYAHSQQVRLVWTAGYDVKNLGNADARTAWVRSQVDRVKSTFTDGINIDVEHEIAEGSARSQEFTSLVRELSDVLHTEVNGSQVSVDVAWSAPCKDKRCYDYTGLADASDFLFIMGYDVRSQIFHLKDCIASANAPFASLQAGLTNYTQLFQISPWKLVLGLPWYCYDYRCLWFDSEMNCRIFPEPADGAPCSGMIGDQHHYSVCRELFRVNATTSLFFDNQTVSAFFNYIDATHGHTHQVWMDDPESLLVKYDLANAFQLRGIGMWHADSLDYSTNASSEVKQQTYDMWDAMHRFKN